MKTIERKGPYVLIDGFNSIQLPDHQWYIKIIDWLADDEEYNAYCIEFDKNDPFQDDGPWPRIIDMSKHKSMGMAVDVRETDFRFIEHNGQEYYLIADRYGNIPRK